MNIGIVGHEAAKFTIHTEAEARSVIQRLLRPVDAVLVSGRCPLGGVDVWAEDEAERMGRAMRIFPPKVSNWEQGFKPRNIQIAETSDIVHCIVVAEYPDTYRGRRFFECYHCGRTDHVKSGGCWTALRCRRARWHIIS